MPNLETLTETAAGKKLREQALASDSSSRDRMSMHNANLLKIGLFGVNCSSGRHITKVPERWPATFDENLALARLADDAGIDFLLPVGRWKGYGGDTDYQGESLETLTWATAMLSATSRITVFGTVHAPMFHPVVAAKQAVTADLAGHGRFGLNVVCGWNEGEFEMFGVEQREHDARYEYADEWLRIVKRLWAPEDIPFDFDGKFFSLRRARAKPKPFGGARPLIMNAGSSPVGRAFAIRNCDAFFTDPNRSIADLARAIDAAKSDARAGGREIDVYSIGVVTCRPTRKEAEEYYRHSVVENADWAAIDIILAMKDIRPDQMSAQEFHETRMRRANGMGGLLFVGTPDDVADHFAALAAAGLRGVGISLVNYLDELPYFCDEVLPRLERKGVRVGRKFAVSNKAGNRPAAS